MNPDLEVSLMEGRILSTALYHSSRSDVQIRICHCVELRTWKQGGEVTVQCLQEQHFLISRTAVKLVNWDLYLVPWEQHVFSKILNLVPHGMKHTMLAVWQHSLPPHYQVQSLQMWPFLIRKRELLSFQHQVRIMSFMIFRIMIFKASLYKFYSWYDMWFSWHWLCEDTIFRDVMPRLHSVTFHKTVTFLLYLKSNT